MGFRLRWRYHNPGAELTFGSASLMRSRHLVARSMATSLLSEAFRLRGSMHLSSYDRLFPSQDVHTGRGVGNLIAAPMNSKRRQHGTTVFLDPATLEPYEDQWAYLSSIARLSTKT